MGRVCRDAGCENEYAWMNMHICISNGFLVLFLIFAADWRCWDHGTGAAGTVPAQIYGLQHYIVYGHGYSITFTWLQHYMVTACIPISLDVVMH